MDAYIHRVATSGVYTDTYLDVCYKWSLLDLFEAHAVLDAMAAARQVVE